jgi:hypothetical protein
MGEDSHSISARISRLHDEYVSLRFRSSSSLSKTSANPQSIQTRSFGDAKMLFVRFSFPGRRMLISLVNAFTFSDRQEKQATTASSRYRLCWVAEENVAVIEITNSCDQRREYLATIAIALKIPRTGILSGSVFRQLPLASIQTFIRIRVLLRDARAPRSRDIYLPAFASRPLARYSGTRESHRVFNPTPFCRPLQTQHS